MPETPIDKESDHFIFEDKIGPTRQFYVPPPAAYMLLSQ
jgi:hypothetical protein